MAIGSQVAMKDSTDPVLSCLFGSLVEDCAGSFENGAHFVGIDHVRLIQRIGFQTHQPSRHLIFDGGRPGQCSGRDK
jgi:hypothetical protein